MFSEEEHIFLPLLWDVGDLNVFVDGRIQIMELVFQHHSFFRVFEVMEGFSEGVCLVGVSEVMESFIIFLGPV